jgi:hypothetical protein
MSIVPRDVQSYNGNWNTGLSKMKSSQLGSTNGKSAFFGGIMLLVLKWNPILKNTEK